MRNFNLGETGKYILEAIFDKENQHYDVRFSIDKEMAEKISYKEFRTKTKDVMMKGFRKGKAPKSLMERNAGGRKAFYSAAFSIYANTIILENAPSKVLLTSDHSIKEEDNGWWIVKFKLLLEPEANIPDNILDMSFDLPKLSIEEYVSSRMRAFAQIHPILRSKATDEGEPIPAAERDMVEVQIEAIVDNQRFEDGCEEATNIRLIKGAVNPKELYDRLIGVNPGDFFKIETDDIPDTFPEIKGKIITLEVQVKYVYFCEDAEIDEDLALTANFDNFQSWENYLKDAGKRITEAADLRNRKLIILDYISKKVNMPEFSRVWATQRAMEALQAGKIQSLTSEMVESIATIARQQTILKFIGEKFNIEWDEDDKDKGIHDRNETAYAEKVLLWLLEQANFSYVDSESEGSTEENRGDGGSGGSPSPDRKGLGEEFQTQV